MKRICMKTQEDISPNTLHVITSKKVQKVQSCLTMSVCPVTSILWVLTAHTSVS